MKPIISIIMPCYNQEKYIGEAVDSVLSQTFTNWELIIVDDGSTDDSYSIMKDYAGRDERITCYRQDNAGPSKARNHGVKYANGKYLLFFDSDDKLASTYLEKGVQYMEANENCTVFYPRVQYFGSRNDEEQLRYTSYKSLLCKSSILCTSVLRKKDFDRIGGFDESMKGFEDWEMFIRLLYHNDIVHQSSDILFYYRMHREEGSINAQAIRDSDQLTAFIYNKNRTIYNEFFGDPIKSIMRCHYLEEEMEKLLQSKKYRIGEFLSSPLLFYQKNFSSHSCSLDE